MSRESGYYPPGAEFDPRAPWNQIDPPEDQYCPLCDEHTEECNCDCPSCDEAARYCSEHCPDSVAAREAYERELYAADARDDAIYEAHKERQRLRAE